jgi:lipopolysaccharide/colanic/teichoic acid biosynthesis glycosyltransferase
MQRLFDFFFSLLLLILLTPLLLLIAIMVKLDSRGPALFNQQRVGLNGVDFTLFKFRTMKVTSENKSLLTVGNDSRITRAGKWLRKYKFDELPQLFNVLLGDMSLVGPRPEVRKYVELYTDEQKRILSVRPGITDPVSLTYFDESALLGQSDNPEKTYIEELMPMKIKHSLAYIDKKSLATDFMILVKTVLRIIGIRP